MFRYKRSGRPHHFDDGIADPLKEIGILTNLRENLVLIVKDGKIYKNTIN